MSKDLVLIDWGTSNCRAILINAAGDVLDKFSSEKGVSKVDKEGMAAVVAEITALWGDKDPTYYACGMIGSTIGWKEMPYLACPANRDQLAAATEEVDFNGVTVRMVPGVKYQNEAGGFDVMRGEELQAIGWAAMQPSLEEATGLCVMPGTHSKWSKMEAGSLKSFFTAMTGEMFALLKTHGLLQHNLTEKVAANELFLNGVKEGQSQEGIARKLFSVRPNSLLAGMSNEAASGYVSGLLIGAEIADALSLNGWKPEDGPVHIIGNAILGELYGAALKSMGYESVALESNEVNKAGFMAVDAVYQG